MKYLKTYESQNTHSEKIESRAKFIESDLPNPKRAMDILCNQTNV